jgi:prepilin-type N-terminal cleavage/methylation domain-containing protein
MRKETEVKQTHCLVLKRKSPGFTLIEVLVAMILLVILAAIAFSVYTNYLNKARIAIAESSLDNVRDNLELYSIDNGKYPDSIDFSTCADENGRAVLSPSVCTQLAKDTTPESYSYTPADGNYMLKARAKDTNKTLMTLTRSRITR